jgi:tetratricopeptide (TPR) repeat protein
MAPPPEAFEAYERAIRAMQRHEYADGAAEFQTLIERFPGERALLDRARVHIELCQRELQNQTPKSLEERMTAATAALNDDDEKRAEALAKGVLAEDGDHDMALYLLAVVEMRRRSPDGALAYLRRAVEISPEAAAQARLDADFEAMRDLDAFKVLTDTHSPAAPREARRARRGR